jgi:hypothetical protein
LRTRRVGRPTTEPGHYPVHHAMPAISKKPPAGEAPRFDPYPALAFVLFLSEIRGQEPVSCRPNSDSYRLMLRDANAGAVAS